MPYVFVDDLDVRKELAPIAPRFNNECWCERWYKLTGKRPIIVGERKYLGRRNFSSGKDNHIVGVE